MSHRRAVLLMIAVTLMWSIAGVITRQLEHARSFEVTFWRSFFTVLSLLMILPFFQGRQVFANIRNGGRRPVDLGPVLERDVHGLHGGAHPHQRRQRAGDDGRGAPS